MNHFQLGCSVGPLLYCPALNEKIAASVLSGQFGGKYSVALCLEDTIADTAVEQALDQLMSTFQTLHQAAQQGTVLPRIFVRVRNPQQIATVFQKISPYISVFSGFIFPKYSMESADSYNREFLQVLQASSRDFYMMPILESGDIIDRSTRAGVLCQLKQKIDSMKDHVLNVRVGGNDFCNAFGLRRHVDETIYDILPIAQLLCDILTVFSRDYVVSGPVWEYYSGEGGHWSEGLKRELKYDLLNGFIGKTVIHPNQIPIVTEALKVNRLDYEDAMEILSWQDGNGLLVGGSADRARMNEVKTHLRWARKIAALAAVYGVQEDA